MNNVKLLIDRLPSPTNEDDSYKNFITLYNCFTPADWLRVETLFDVSNYIARNRPELVDLGTRLNVQVNLYLRTILNYQTKPDFDGIGCFALTESSAGVLSGLIVDVTFEETHDGYTLNSGTVTKKWISQGMLAEKGLVVASNVSNRRDCRIFLMDMNVEGISKTRLTHIPVSRLLDLAEISYTDVRLSKSSVLEKTIPLTRKELLMGIFYGRLCLAEVVMNSIAEFVDVVYNKIKDIEKFEKIGHLQYIARLNDKLREYCIRMEERRLSLLETNDVFQINCYKIHCVETAIYIYNKIHMMFGTHAFGFGLDYQTLILNKVAEGDTSVLKLACIKHYVETRGLYHGVSYSRWLGLLYNPMGYVQQHRDALFDEIVAKSIDVLDIT
jgi:hypothetical protein